MSISHHDLVIIIIALLILVGFGWRGGPVYSNPQGPYYYGGGLGLVLLIVVVLLILGVL